ncbi:MAG TPA: hypothetical protein VGQ73_02990, partial [Gemmatimonadales bacterium]|nr:hypothetical protein [Gemmatimonadales bacterium]
MSDPAKLAPLEPVEVRGLRRRFRLLKAQGARSLRGASTILAFTTLLVSQADSGAQRTTADRATIAGPSAAAEASSFAALDRAIGQRDPTALADTTLPRLADLDSTQR